LLILVFVFSPSVPRMDHSSFFRSPLYFLPTTAPPKDDLDSELTFYHTSYPFFALKEYKIASPSCGFIVHSGLSSLVFHKDYPVSDSVRNRPYFRDDRRQTCFSDPPPSPLLVRYRSIFRSAKVNIVLESPYFLLSYLYVGIAGVFSPFFEVFRILKQKSRA